MTDATVRVLEARIDDLTSRLRCLEARIQGALFEPPSSGERPLPSKAFLTVREAAAYTGFSPSMLNRWRCDLPGGPRFSKIGRRVLYAKADLDEFIEGRRRKSLA